MVGVEPGGRDGGQALQVGAGQQGVSGERLLTIINIKLIKIFLSPGKYF